MVAKLCMKRGGEVDWNARWVGGFGVLFGGRLEEAGKRVTMIFYFERLVVMITSHLLTVLLPRLETDKEHGSPGEAHDAYFLRKPLIRIG